MLFFVFFYCNKFHFLVQMQKSLVESPSWRRRPDLILDSAMDEIDWFYIAFPPYCAVTDTNNVRVALKLSKDHISALCFYIPVLNRLRIIICSSAWMAFCIMHSLLWCRRLKGGMYQEKYSKKLEIFWLLKLK